MVPIGERLAHALTRGGSAFWLFAFAFVLGFGTTIAEPALLAVAEEAPKVAEQAALYDWDRIGREAASIGKPELDAVHGGPR